MFSLKRWLLCAALALSSQLSATPSLTTISDVLYNADGTRFNGVLTISWQSFVASDASNVAANTESINITNGILYVQLIPTTNAQTSAIYTVQYTSSRGTQYSEIWTVSPSILPLRVSDVRVPAGSITGTGPAAQTTIQINDVTGLQVALSSRVMAGPGFVVSRAAVINPSGSIDGAVGNLSDCLHVDGSSGACGGGGGGASATFADGETPGGAVNGSNASFTLSNAPNPASSLALYRNGLLLEQGLDYTLSGTSISFQSADIPQPGDILQASYRASVSLTGVGFVDQEKPAGSMNGVNASFTLSKTPSPAASLVVYLNGLRLSPGVDYTASGATITFQNGLQPQAQDILLCSYRIAQ